MSSWHIIESSSSTTRRRKLRIIFLTSSISFLIVSLLLANQLHLSEASIATTTSTRPFLPETTTSLPSSSSSSSSSSKRPSLSFLLDRSNHHRRHHHPGRDNQNHPRTGSTSRTTSSRRRRKYYGQIVDSDNSHQTTTGSSAFHIVLTTASRIRGGSSSSSSSSSSGDGAGGGEDSSINDVPTSISDITDDSSLAATTTSITPPPPPSSGGTENLSTAAFTIPTTTTTGTTENQSVTTPTTMAVSTTTRSTGEVASTTTTTSTTTTPTTKKTTSSWTWNDARRTLFPIYGKEEVTKFLLIGSIKFFIILALTLTRDTKDTLVVTQSGAEAIAFLKIYGVLPAATAFIALYSKMSDLLPKKALFYATCIPFFAFFLLFDVFIYPNAHILHPSLKTVQAFLPGDTTSGGIAVLANIVAHWTSALFYIVSEIYSSVSVGLLFWQFANDVVPVDQAKRFYPLFAQMSGLAPVLAGQYVVRFASKAPDFGSSMHRLTAAVTFAGIMICFFYHLSTGYIARTEHIAPTDTPSEGDAASGVETQKKKKKPKMSMVESIKFLASSQYLRLIAALVLGYGLSINFTEVMWKSLVKKQYPNPLDYQRFMGNFSSAVGLSTCIVILFGVHVIRILGWRVGAVATPAIMAILAAPFFACILLGLDSPVRLHIAVVLGTIQSLLSKTSKYALFDPTTQMAYIPLDPDSKVKGKAAIDVLGSRIGKSGGSLIQQILVFGFGNIINAAPAVGVIFYSVLLAWMSAANKLSKLFVAQTEMDKANQQMMEGNDKKSTKTE